MMKILIALGILVIVFTSCGTLVSPETQYERERLIEAYDATRQKHGYIEKDFFLLETYKE